MKKQILTILAALAIGAGSLKAGDYATEELRREIESKNSELETQARKLRNLSYEAEANGQSEHAYELQKAARRVRDAQIDLY